MKNVLKNKKEFAHTPNFGVTPKGGGFTLMEILVGVSIFILVTGVLTLFLRNVLIYNSSIFTELTEINAGRTALKTMKAEIRTASSGSDGAYAISLANATSFTFYSDIYDDGLKEKIRYFLDGTKIQKGVIKPTGSPLSYVAGNEVITTLVSGVISTSIFSYYDKNYDGTTAALPFPVDISSVRLVKITFVIEENPNRSPSPISLSTQVSLRNIKDNL